MKPTLAVIVALILFILGWLALGALLSAVGYVAMQGHHGLRILVFLHALLTWTLAPGYGAFVATLVTPRLMGDVDANTIATSFISVVVTLSFVLAGFVLVLGHHRIANVPQFLVFFAQLAAIVIGAKLGKGAYVARYAVQAEDSTN